ncbi:MAG: hypothetical protein HXX13_11675 [Bacteroidetes bacterium]|nr:hypothetical protein [Bacteroidota bacterium]
MNQYLKFYILGFLSVALITALFISSCSEKVQSIPTIDGVLLSMDTVPAGSIALLTVLASDADGDELVFSYTTNGGKISGYGDSVYWLAPLQGGLYRTIIRVTDPSGNQVSDSVKLYVLPSGKSALSGTASFAEGKKLDLSSAKVRLFTSLAARSAGQSADSVNVFGFGSIVSFSFPAVAPGTYYLDVWKDMDNSITLSPGDFLGWYGSGDYANSLLKPIVIEENTPKQLQVEMNVVP